MIELYYSPKDTNRGISIDDIDLFIDLSDNLEEYDFDSIETAIETVTDLLTNGDGKTVYLISLEFKDSFDTSEFKVENEIYVSHNSMFVEFFMTSHVFIDSIQKIFLQEYHSYESAYDVSLSMREGHDLCYED